MEELGLESVLLPTMYYYRKKKNAVLRNKANKKMCKHFMEKIIKSIERH